MNLNYRSPKENSIAVTEQLLKLLNINVTSSTIKQKLELHPYFPSFLAINDCLSEWGIDSQCHQVDKTNYLKNLQPPFVAHLNEAGGRFVLIKSMENNKFVLSDEKYNNLIVKESDFLGRWSGFVLCAIGNSKSGEANYIQNRFKEILTILMTPLVILILGIILYLKLINQNIEISTLTLIFLKLGGIVISVLLLMHSLNANNPFIKNLCTLNGKNDCNAILKSDAAKVTSWLSWSEVGFFYFTGSFLLLLFDSTSLFLLAVLSLFTLPYIIYSISYQYRSKNWCILCCIVQVILAIEAVISIRVVIYEAPFFPVLGITYFISVISPILLWYYLKPSLTAASQLKPLKQQLNKFKYNDDFFNQALKKQQYYIIPDDLMPIILGNPNAKITITMVSNPFCIPCGKAHEVLDQLLKTRDDVKLKIIFTTTNHDNDEKTQISRHLLALSLLKDNKLIEFAINDWYKQSDKHYSKWAKKYSIAIGDDIIKLTSLQKQWCKMAKISSTPTVLINGYKLPDLYRIEDIEYLL